VRVRVGLNLIYLVPGETGGTETYAREVIPELVAAAPEGRFIAFVNRETASTDGPWRELIPTVTVPVSARNRLDWVRGEQQLLPRLAAAAQVDLVHSLANTAPARGPYRRVVTIHDLNYRIVPEAHLGLRGAGMRVLVPLAARRSDRIITDAASTREDLRRLLKIEPDKVDVVPLGVGTSARAQPRAEADVRLAVGAGERPIVLTASAKRPHKNLARLIAAIALIPAPRRPLLVLAGYPTPYESELRERASELSVAGDVCFLPWVEEDLLEGLYATAACFAFPSLYEGFGLPVLEAMARAVPVVCSDRGSLVEVAGDAALKVNPESERSIASALERILGDRGEAERLRAAGLTQAARFSWTATAKGTLAVYERVLGSR
jgi:glycosyltransferase involved in cell wall biosynthesis